MGDPFAIPFLNKVLEDKEHKFDPIVRHEVNKIISLLERKKKKKKKKKIIIIIIIIKSNKKYQAAEALAAIGKEESLILLEKYSEDASPEVADTCKIAKEHLKWKINHNGFIFK
jgi:hypothetical protein